MKPTIRSSKTLYKGFFEVRQDLLEKSDGQTLAYTSLLLGCDAVAVLAQDKEGRWILNREYRYPVRNHLLGCPGGRLETGEDPIEGGRRELFEETGYWADEILVMGSSYPFAGVCDQKIHFLLAKNAYKKGAQRLDPFEQIDVEIKTPEELRQEIASGALIDGILCAALWYHTHCF